ncbi:MAG: hypothetical protein A2Y25_08170 [Candidatus Melainabacteria bacterium GWF2_37_15]|nr:MAG: hypothetical protein A2Y25_08170 [Candidatus Melainabacteria bacterium GWF2_37_15]
MITTKRIKQLPDNLINQIAAGEAIERPASVVKELVENSIDAGSTRIEVEISNATRDIRVADNGGGIHKDDILLAFSRHATSKIEKINDLWSISTLGFRGEALSSMISIAKVICTTRTKDSETGLKVKCENSQVSFSDAGCAIGTTMEINDLFYNVPARLKFLKKTQTEMAAISEIVQSLAISNPGIAFTLIHNKNTIFKTIGSNDLAATIGEVYSSEIISELVEINKEDEQFNLKIHGFASNPDFTRSNKKAIYTFINGRTVKCPIISKAIDTAYSDMIPSGRYPYVVLNILMSPKEIDVNVHPTKKEVKYSKPNLIFNFVYSAIKGALGVAPQRHSQDVGCIYAPEQQGCINAPYEIPKVINFPKAITQEIEDDDIQEVSFAPASVQKRFEVESDGYDLFVEKPRIIGQLENTYILIQAKDGLQIIDQHIAHERALYEKLKREKNYASQLLLASEVIELTPEQYNLFRENADLLNKYGYEVEIIDFGIKLKRIPQTIAEKDPKKIVNDLIEALESSPEIIENELLMRTACLSSVKAGERLSIGQMEELIINWQNTSYPKTCPHGRKIAHVISRQEIAGFFGRQL